MKLKIFFSLVSFLFAGSALSQSLYLTCSPLSGPQPKYTTLYKVPPPDAREKVVGDMIAEGLVMLLLPRPESWVVNMTENRIFSPEANSGFPFKNPVVTEARIFAEHDTGADVRYSYDLNRVTGKLTYLTYLGEDTVATWRKKHGGTLPSIWRWEHKCVAQRPAV